MWAGVDQPPNLSPPPQVTPSSSRASTIGASPRAASKPSRTPNPGAQVPGLPHPQCDPRAPRPHRVGLSPETASISMCQCGSVRLQGSLGAPPASSVPARGGLASREGDLQLHGRERIAPRGSRGLWLWEVCPRGRAQPGCSWGSLGS